MPGWLRARWLRVSGLGAGRVCFEQNLRPGWDIGLGRIRDFVGEPGVTGIVDDRLEHVQLGRLGRLDLSGWFGFWRTHRSDRRSQVLDAVDRWVTRRRGPADDRCRSQLLC